MKVPAETFIQNFVKAIDFSGEFSEISYEEIVRGLLVSPLIEAEIKEQLPDPDEL